MSVDTLHKGDTDDEDNDDDDDDDNNNNNNNVSTLHSTASFICRFFISGSPMEVMLYGCALSCMFNAQLLHTKI
jgi:hypothetical protein